MPRLGVNVFPWKLKHWSRETEERFAFDFFLFFSDEMRGQMTESDTDPEEET